MPTSIAHVFGGMAAAEATTLRGRWSDTRVLLFFALVANLPDADFLPGLLVGDPVLYHREGSHSLLAALIVALACAGIAAARGADARRWFSIAFLVYLSHLALDMLATGGPASSTGVPLLWPLIRDRWFVELPLPTPLAELLDLDLNKTGPGGFFPALFSWHGAEVFLGHALLFAPLPLIARLIRVARERLGDAAGWRPRPRPRRVRPLEPDPDPVD